MFFYAPAVTQNDAVWSVTTDLLYRCWRSGNAIIEQHYATGVGGEVRGPVQVPRAQSCNREDRPGARPRHQHPVPPSSPGTGGQRPRASHHFGPGNKRTYMSSVSYTCCMYIWYVDVTHEPRTRTVRVRCHGQRWCVYNTFKRHVLEVSVCCHPFCAHVLDAGPPFTYTFTFRYGQAHQPGMGHAASMMTLSMVSS